MSKISSTQLYQLIFFIALWSIISNCVFRMSLFTPTSTLKSFNLEQGLANYSLWTNSILSPVFVKKVLNFNCSSILNLLLCSSLFWYNTAESLIKKKREGFIELCHLHSLCIVCGCFCLTSAELSNYNRVFMV